jgi:hypothetical protein
LETPNYVREFRGGTDSTEEYWAEYKKCILEMSDFVLCNPGPTFDAAKKWLPEFKGEFYECPPPINISAANKVSSEEKNEVVFIGRHLDFKCPDDVVFAVSKIHESQRPIINFIGSHNDNVRNRILNKANPLGVICQFYAGVNDYEKFYILKRSKVMIIPSKFEGFGMPPAEAIFCGKPVICYELPVTRHVYGDAVIYVKSGDVKGLGKKLRELLDSPVKRLDHAKKAITLMYSNKSNIPSLPIKMKNTLRNIFYGKHNNLGITAGIIVLNGADVIRFCLESIRESVDKIIIVEGAVEEYAKQNPDLVIKGGSYHSVDDTLGVIAKFMDDYPDCALHTGKIEVVAPPDGRWWKNKNEMQNEIAKRVKTPLYLKVDSDEIWKESDIEYCRRLFVKDKSLYTVYMRRWHFWKNLTTVAIGGQWDSAEARMWRWKDGFHHTMDDKKGFNYLVDEDGKVVNEMGGYKSAKLLQRMHYHLGYCRKSEHIVGKIKYYANRGIEHNVKDHYTNWKEGEPTNSTHPDGTTAIPFKGKLPFVLRASFHNEVQVFPKQCVQNNLGMLNARSKEDEV